jgi:hypothetical protein
LLLAANRMDDGTPCLTTLLALIIVKLLNDDLRPLYTSS